MQWTLLLPSVQSNGVALAVVTAIFFMWGFLTCLNDILIPHLKAAFALTWVQAMLVQFTFFGAYFLMSLPAGRLVAAVGYKRGIVAGLAIAGVGALLFWPAAQAHVYGLFLGALFVLATGITVLQVAANPYVALLGPEQTSSSRLTLAQSMNALGTTIAPLFGGLLILSARRVPPMNWPCCRRPRHWLTAPPRRNRCSFRTSAWPSHCSCWRWRSGCSACRPFPAWKARPPPAVAACAMRCAIATCAMACWPSSSTWARRSRSAACWSISFRCPVSVRG